MNKAVITEKHFENKNRSVEHKTPPRMTDSSWMMILMN